MVYIIAAQQDWRETNTFAVPPNKNGPPNSNSEPVALRELVASYSCGIPKTARLVLAPPAFTPWANLMASLLLLTHTVEGVEVFVDF